MLQVYWELCKLPCTPFYLLLQLAAAHVPVLVNSRCWTPARHHTASSQACLLWSMSLFFKWYSASCIMTMRKQCKFNFSQCEDVLRNYIYIGQTTLKLCTLELSKLQAVCMHQIPYFQVQASTKCVFNSVLHDQVPDCIYCSTTVVLWGCCISPYASYYYGFAIQTTNIQLQWLGTGNNICTCWLSLRVRYF